MENEAEKPTGPETHRIPAYRFGDLEKQVEKLNKKARKWGLPELTLVLVKNEIERTIVGETNEFPPRPIYRDIMVAYVQVVGEMPVVAGWAFIARLEHHAAGCIVSRAPDARVDELDLSAWYKAEPKCEHCQISRGRKVTYLLADVETFTIRQVGSTCLEDYCRSVDVEHASHLFGLWSKLFASFGDPDGEWGFSRAPAVTPTDRYLAYAVHEVNSRGFRPSKFSDSTRSVCDFADAPCPKLKDYPDNRKEIAAWKAAQPVKADFEEAVRILEWLTTNTDPGDYLHNLRLIASEPAVSNRNRGLLASAPQAYAKAHGTDACWRTEKKEPVPPSKHIGTAKQRMTVECECIGQHVYENSMGGSGLLLRFRCVDGAMLLWFSSAERPQDWENWTGSLKFTVKAHEADRKNGEPVTIISRAAKIEPKAQAAA